VRIMAICNRVGDKGVSGGRMPDPLNRRFTHFELTPTVEGWCDHITATCKKPNKQGNVMGVDAATKLVAFMLWRGRECLDTYDPTKPAICVASPRGWEAAGCYLGDKLLPDSIRQSSIAGVIGDHWAIEFETFIRMQDKVLPIKKIIADPLGVDLPTEASLQWATVVSVSGAMNLKTITPLYKFVKRLDPEFVIMAFTLALKRDTELLESDEFVLFSKDYKAVFSNK
jgi:hypothetical protein